MSDSVSITDIYQGVATKATPIPLFASSPQAGFPAPGDDLIHEERFVATTIGWLQKFYSQGVLQTIQQEFQSI